MVLPKKITTSSIINLIHTSSPLGRGDLRDVNLFLAKISKTFLNVKIFDVKRTELDPRYLAASTKERLEKFRQAIKKVDWLLPTYGGTGCEDIVRRLNNQDLAKIRKNRPIVNGFSDTTFLINYLYFKLRLITFHYCNASNLLSANNLELFFDIIQGKEQSFSFFEKEYKWLTDYEPKQNIEGIAIGGNLRTFRDLLDICNIELKSWESYILFIEETDEDIEDLHRVISVLDEKGIFRHIKALVIGRMNEEEFRINFRRFNFIFGRSKEKAEHIIEYLLSDVIKERCEKKDPLYILKINNLGHGVKKNPIIIPIGAKTIIHPNKKIEFEGPFVM